MLEAQCMAGTGRQLRKQLRCAMRHHSPSVLLFSAAAAGSGRAVRWLLQHARISSSVQSRALLLAAMRGHDGVLAALLTPPGKPDVLARDNHGLPALHLAVDGKHIRCVELLLAAGALHAVDSRGRTALHMAGVRHRYGLVHQLAAAGADVNKPIVEGYTLLHFVAIKGEKWMKLGQLLVELGADVNKADADGRTPLHAAAQTGAEGVLQLLLSAGANVHARCDTGITALHLAAQYGGERTVQLLAAAGAHVEAADNTGDTPLLHAVRFGSDRVIRALVAAGANVNASNNFNKTAVYLAAREGKLSTVQLLLQHGAAAGTVDVWAETALSLAVWNGHAETAKLLAANQAQTEPWAVQHAAATASKAGRLDIFAMLVRELGKHHPERLPTLLADVGMCGASVAAAFSAVVHGWVFESSTSALQQQRAELAAEKLAVQHLIVAAAGMGKRLLEQQWDSSRQPAAKRRKRCCSQP